MANADGGAPVLVDFGAGRALKVGPDVGLLRDVEVRTHGVLDPGVLAVDFDRIGGGAGGVQGREPAVALF